MLRDDSGSQGIGQSVRRKEDFRLITGQGQFAADQFPANVAHAVMVRSPHAHARLVSIDTVAARATPGVLGVFTGADLIADGLKPIPHNPDWTAAFDVTLQIRPGTDVFLTEHYAMPADRARFVGEPVAMVVADTLDAARDAAEKVAIDYEILPSVVDGREAVASGAPHVWDACHENTAIDADVGDDVATRAAFARAAHIVRFDSWIQRVCGSPMEPRAAIGDYEPATQSYSIWAGSGRGVVTARMNLAGMLDVPLERCRALCGDMGGNFGTRNNFYPEFGLLPWAARRIGRPVKWVADRQECFVSDYQGRDCAVSLELALDADGHFLGLRGGILRNIGAYSAHFGPMRKTLGILSGVYRIPTVHLRGRCVFTHTVPTIAYRSSGRPEAIYTIERLVDLAADRLGIDRVDLRRRNFIPPAAMPYTNGVGITYDNGEYEKGMDAALKLADWNGFAARRASSRARGRLRGIGLANYIEGSSGPARERAEITVDPSGQVELVLGTMNSGQGHETSFAQLIETWLGVPFSSVKYVAHDTARVSVGGGSTSGRSMRIASLAVGDATDRVIEKGKKIAAHVFEVDPGDVDFHSGTFRVKDRNLFIGIFEVAKAAATRADLPAELRGALEGIGDHTVAVGAFPNGTHICEVEVDPDTGQVEIVRWSGVDDVGLAVNPMILHGQTHGAVAQGVGQALLESSYYDRSSGQLLSGSYMDYAMPRADVLPSFNCELIELPATSHRYGIRPGGEGGVTPSLGVIINAVVDALSEFGVKHVEMPATPRQVWRAIQAAKSKKAAK
jgi:carbon-monoxide dehydrogenase large subunit